MLEAVDLKVKLKKDEFRDRMNGPEGLLNRLRSLQRRCREAKVPVAVVFEGWDAAGKGTLIGTLVDRLDPRGFQVHPISAPLPEEKLRPFLWRHWMKLPPDGHFAIFDRSWYGRVLVERVDQLISEHDVRDALAQIMEFERQLAADGMVICKFFLHISKKEQKQRFKAMEKDPFTAWKVQDEDWRHHKQYDQYVVAIEDMLAYTSRSHAPWTIVEATDLRWAQAKVFQTLCDTIDAALDARGVPEVEIDLAAAMPPEGVLNEEESRLFYAALEAAQAELAAATAAGQAVEEVE